MTCTDTSYEIQYFLQSDKHFSAEMFPHFTKPKVSFLTKQDKKKEENQTFFNT